MPTLPRSSPRSRRPVLAVLALTVLAVGSLAGCTGSDEPDDGTLQVVTSFYPLQWMAEQVGGDHVSVSNLTKAGAEPHDLELSPHDVASIQDADVVAYLDGFQPAVDTAIADVNGGNVFDATADADLDLTFTPIEDGKASGDAGATDPHFWLDPTRLADVATAFAHFLGEVDPANEADYEANADALAGQLAELDGDLKAGLADCANTNLVTSHNAFGYLAQRYGFEQVGITGLTPEGEPAPGDLAAVSDFVEEHDVRTIYFETLVSPAIADTVAQETGARTEVLDPIEGLDDSSQGDDYLEIMRSNLANLREGQPCR